MIVVAIDGPSGSGKSSTARGVAQRFGFAYLDTGAMYRACTWVMLSAGASTDHQIVDVVRQVDLQVVLDPLDPRFGVSGTDVTDLIREPRVSAAVSRLAGIAAVREMLIARQQELIASAREGIVAEGRDITTVVAPDAQVRVLLTADPRARIARRSAELGASVDAATVRAQVVGRDHADSAVTQFELAADGVVTIDSTTLSLPQVIDAVGKLVTDAQKVAR